MRRSPSLASPAAARRRRTSAPAEPEQLDLALDFYVNPDHAGLYTGLEHGYFKRAGLEVTPRVPSDPSAPIKEVAAGRADLAISYEPEVLLAREQGLDVVAVAALVDEPLTSLISLPAGGIAKPADLRGKTVATAGIPYQADYLATILSGRRALDLGRRRRSTSASTCCPRCWAGRPTRSSAASATSRESTSPGAAPDPSVVPVNELGVPTYDELVLVAQGDELEEDPEEIRLFIARARQGHQGRGRRPGGGDQGRPRGRRAASTRR